MRRRCFRKRRTAVIVTVTAVLFVIVFTAIRIDNALLRAAKAYSVNTATKAVSESVCRVFKNIDKSEYSSVSVNDRATIYETDTAAVNLINSALTKALQGSILRSNVHTVKIPLGAIFHIATFSALGPKIPVRINPINVVKTDIDEEFYSSGINQVRHSISVKAEVNVGYSVFLGRADETVSVTVPITDSVIIGDVPEYYGNGNVAIGN